MKVLMKWSIFFLFIMVVEVNFAMKEADKEFINDMNLSELERYHAIIENDRVDMLREEVQKTEAKRKQLNVLVEKDQNNETAEKALAKNMFDYTTAQQELELYERIKIGELQTSESLKQLVHAKVLFFQGKPNDFFEQKKLYRKAAKHTITRKPNPKLEKIILDYIHKKRVLFKIEDLEKVIEDLGEETIEKEKTPKKQIRNEKILEEKTPEKIQHIVTNQLSANVANKNCFWRQFVNSKSPQLSTDVPKNRFFFKK